MKKGILFLGCSIALSITLLVSHSFIHSLAIVGSKQLNGTIIVIDPGHGGKDPGAVSNHATEDLINLDVSLKLKTILEAAGAQVILTRDSDYDLAPENANSVKREDLSERVKVLNQENVTLFISIHCNISLNQKCSGAEAYYRIEDDNSKGLATSILESLRDITSSKYQAKKGDYYILNNTSNLGTLIEIGFLSNKEDASKLQKSSYQDEIAYGITKGIINYLRILQ